MTSTRISRPAFLVVIASLLLAASFSSSPPQKHSELYNTTQKSPPVWCPDNRDGTYSNPIIYADYSDPDIIRVGDVYTLTSSSFAHIPGLPILQSNDLVNWRIVGHAIARYPVPSFDLPQHGNGVWSPSIRYRDGRYSIYFGDPDAGIFVTSASNPSGPWDSLTLIREAKGWIDPCPFWDDDGNAYLVHAWAKSRAGFNSILTLNRMNAEGTRILDEGTAIFDGHVSQPTIEGPKMYKRNGYYYVFAPAGGVKTGWQTVLRSKNIYGPYEARIVLGQGKTDVNGPHQGAWVETPSGESWFVHFQDRGAYGRIVHLEPMQWVDDWPAIGVNPDSNGVGAPVLRYKKPNAGRSSRVEVPATSDEFSSSALRLQWQWESNPGSNWYSLVARSGWLRLYAQQVPGEPNLWSAGNILGQKIPAPEFQCETMLDCSRLEIGETAGLVVLGTDYSYVGVRRDEGGLHIVRVACTGADKGGAEREVASERCNSSKTILRLNVKAGATCDFSFRNAGENVVALGGTFVAKAGRWVGAKVGIFAVRGVRRGPAGYAEFDWIRFRPEPKSH